MIRKLLLIVCVFTVIQGCTSTKNDPTPDDFIVRQDSASFNEQLNALAEEDYVIKFRRGNNTISEKEESKLSQWITEARPSMVTIRGTGGASKYLELGEQRKESVIHLLRNIKAGIDVIPLDYDPLLPGGRAVIAIVSDEFAQQVRDNAPILIIKTH